MQIQTLSVVVPTVKCVNDCPFCVSKLHESQYINQIEKNKRFRDLYQKDYLKRMQFARDNGCNTVILTGDGEPLQNVRFLEHFANWNQMLPKPFQWIELQSTGVFIDDEMLRFLRNTVGVTTISISVSDIFDSDSNNNIIRTPPKAKINLPELFSEIKRYDFNLRLSINLVEVYNKCRVGEIFYKAKEYNADQIIFRVLYEAEGGGNNKEVNEWIAKHRANDHTIKSIKSFIEFHGRPLERLPFGAIRYSVDGMSTVVDDDCMSTEVKEQLKYLVLQRNCKLYTKWDDPASLLF